MFLVTKLRDVALCHGEARGALRDLARCVIVWRGVSQTNVYDTSREFASGVAYAQLTM